MRMYLHIMRSSRLRASLLVNDVRALQRPAGGVPRIQKALKPTGRWPVALSKLSTLAW